MPLRSIGEAYQYFNQEITKWLDEHPAAYKDIDTVMDSQKDTTRIVHTLRQVVNYKGWN